MLAHLPHHPGLTVHDLYEAYPRQDIDVGREQELLEGHDVVVCQFPFYWYSTPPILKQWQDLVLEHGWAYGSEGTALHGKTLLCALSAGGRRVAYAPEGHNRFTIPQLLAPIEQTARLCGMRFLPPFVVFGTHRLTAGEIETEARRYGSLVSGLLADRPVDSLPGDPELFNDVLDSWQAGGQP
jgi:glutathione-regulated potassium-efflux system ancillary protein KefG